MSKSAFITGATGFLGAFTSAYLLRQGFQVTALVRNAPDRDLRPLISRIGRLQRSFPEDLAASFRAVEGDVLAKDLGLSQGDTGRIADETTDVWHFAAAFDDQDKSGGLVFATNVDGADNLLNFLSNCRRPIRLNFVSTAYAAPVLDGIAYERLSDPEEIKTNNYENSKAEAERRVTAFCAAKGIELRIFRPPIVAGESASGMSLGQTGYQGVFRALYLLKRRLEINIGTGFDHDLRLRVIADPDLPVNVVPVDFVVEAMWRLTQAAETSGGIYNITGARYVRLATLFEAASESLGVSGITLSTAHDFSKLEMSMAERLFRRRMKFQEPYFLRRSRFDTEIFRRAVGEEELPSPDCEEAYLALCNQYCLEDMEQEFTANLDEASGGPLGDDALRESESLACE